MSLTAVHEITNRLFAIKYLEEKCAEYGFTDRRGDRIEDGLAVAVAMKRIPGVETLLDALCKNKIMAVDFCLHLDDLFQTVKNINNNAPS